MGRHLSLVWIARTMSLTCLRKENTLEIWSRQNDLIFLVLDTTYYGWQENKRFSHFEFCQSTPQLIQDELM